MDNGFVIKCNYHDLVAIDELAPNPKNPTRHPKKQLELFAKILVHQGVRKPVVVSERSGFVVKGHGALEAAKLNGWTEFPVEYQEYESAEQEFEDMVADNKLAELAESDDDLIKIEVLKMPEVNLEMLAFNPLVDKSPKKKGLEKNPSQLVHTCPKCGHEFS